jgi:hypothetical protein
VPTFTSTTFGGSAALQLLTSSGDTIVFPASGNPLPLSYQYGDVGGATITFSQWGKTTNGKNPANGQ